MWVDEPYEDVVQCYGKVEDWAMDGINGVLYPAALGYVLPQQATVLQALAPHPPLNQSICDGPIPFQLSNF